MFQFQYWDFPKEGSFGIHCKYPENNRKSSKKEIDHEKNDMETYICDISYDYYDYIMCRYSQGR